MKLVQTVTPVVALVASIVAPASAATPTAQVHQVGASTASSYVAFDWSFADAEPGTTLTVHYFGCVGDAGYTRTAITGDGTFTVLADRGDLGSDWTRTLTVSQPGHEPYVETVTNTDPALQFSCGPTEEVPVVAHWSQRRGAVRKNPHAGDRLLVSHTRLTDSVPAGIARVHYTWWLGDRIVSLRREVRVRPSWAGGRLTMVVTAASPLNVWRQEKDIAYGRVRPKNAAQPTDLTPSQAAQTWLRLVNRARADLGIAPLGLDRVYSQGAQDWADDYAQNRPVQDPPDYLRPYDQGDTWTKTLICLGWSGAMRQWTYTADKWLDPEMNFVAFGWARRVDPPTDEGPYALGVYLFHRDDQPG